MMPVKKLIKFVLIIGAKCTVFIMRLFMKYSVSKEILAVPLCQDSCPVS